MLDRKKIKAAARTQFQKNSIFLIVMFLLTALFNNDPELYFSLAAEFFPIRTFLSVILAAGIISISSALGIILIFLAVAVLSISIQNIIEITKHSVYLEITKTEQCAKIDVIPEKIANLWLFGIFAGWRICFKIILYIIFPPAAIIKWMEYSQTYYILADKPSIGVIPAMDISREITDGRKGELALLYLSFFGHFILCVFTFGIYLFYLVPYMELTFANAYQELKKDAVANGKINGRIFNQQSENL